MSTTLFEQLQRLKAPQTGAIADARRKASILFDSKEAAGKDRRTIYDLGITGLQELSVLNAKFQQFEETLFDENTLHLERSVEHKEINELINKNIEKFLQHLSPYFLLRPAHLCLEWLIRRFQVNDYNRDELMALVLPYHETNAFVKVIQTFRLKQSDKDWSWLKPLQKPGKPLSKLALINKAATDKGFFNFICKTTLSAIKEFGPNANLLQTQLNFYGSVAVGALEAASSVQEWHITTLLPSLLKGLSSGCIDFVSAAYIITARLVARTQLTTKLCNVLITKVSAVSFQRLRRTAVLLLIWILDSQQAASPQFSEETLHYLVQQSWLTTILSSLTKENVDVQSLVVPLMKASIKALHNQQANSSDFKSFLETLLNDIQFPVTTAQQVISSFLDSYISVATDTSVPAGNSFNDGDIIELDSEDDDVKMPMSDNIDFQSWYSQYLHKLERQYPTAFDKTIKESLSGNKDNMSPHRNKALKMAIGYRLKFFDSSTCDIYESLYHHTPDIRLMAIKTLIKNLKNYQKRPQNLQLLKECLADRINDDSDEIVYEILTLSTEEIIELMGCQTFVEALIGILYKIQIDPQNWSDLSVRVIQHLTSQVVIKDYNNNLLLLALMPILFPIDAEGKGVTGEAIEEIINSPLAEKIRFLKDLHVNVEDFHINDFKRHFLDVIAAAKDTPTAVELFESVASQDDSYFKQAMQLYHFLLLVTAFLKQRYSAKQSLQIFKRISVYSKKYQIRFMGTQNWKAACKLKLIPLQLYCDFLVTLTIHTNFQDLLKQCWNEPDALELHYFLNVFQSVANQCFNNSKQEGERLEWNKMLKELFDTVFQDPYSKAGFLVNFYLYENVAAMENYAILRLQAFKLMQFLIRNNFNLKLSTVHLFKICSALSSKSQTMRLEALETLRIIYSDEHFPNDAFKNFVKSILEHAEEISLDHEQFPLVFYAIINSSKSVMGNQILADVLDLIRKDKGLEQAVFSQKLLELLILFNDVDILTKIIPLGMSALQKFQIDGTIKLLKEPYSKILSLIVDHFNSQTIENILIDDPEAWQFIEKIFHNNLMFMVADGALKSIPSVFLESLDEYAVERMPSKYKQDLLKLLIRTMAEVENDNTFLAANKLFKKCTLDCRPLKEIIQSMHKAKEVKQKYPDIRKSLTKYDSTKALEVQINSLNWKQGVVLMELLENKKKLEHSDCMIPALFELLNICLSVEEQTTVEYTKQLVLSGILHFCQKASEDGCNLQTALPKTTFRMDQVVHCLRASQNPQTHHSALLLLVHCAALFPQQVLHNIVDIFTFMGSSVVRHDDAFSFHIINDIIVSIVPILVKEKSSVITVLKVFSDIMLDVPEHRRLPLYTKFIQTLGSEEYLWMFLCVVFEAHVIDDEKQRLLQKKSNNSSTSASDQIAKRIEIALELSNTFKPQTILQNCIKLMKHVEQLPMQKVNTASIKKTLTNLENHDNSLFDINTHSAKQLRHYKYVIMQFLSAITSSNEFLRQIAVLTEDEILAMKPFYQNFIIRILSFLPSVSAVVEKSDDFSQQRFWKVLLHHLHDVLDNAISLLSPEMFLVVVNGLLQHQLLSIRKKVIELLINKLQQKDSYFMTCDTKHFHNLLQPLTVIVAGILNKDETLDGSQQNELVFLQQTALIAIKLLSKLFALTHIAEFKDILGNLTKISKHRSSISKIILATVVLCMIEISSNLKAHSLAHLPKFMPQLIEILQDQAELVRSHPPDNVCIAIVTGMQKLFETLPLFLGPYIVDIITALSSIGTRITAQNNEKDQRSINTLQKINTIWSKIATEVPARILVPSCEKAYKKLMASKNYADIRVLMKLLHQSLTNANNNDLAQVRDELTALFMEALEFRLQLKNSKVDIESINTTEASIINALVAWVLKLSESSFRPLYHKLYNWALRSSQQKEENILTYFLLNNKIAESLKSLFVLFASDFIEDAARLLNESNANKFDIEPETEYLNIELLKAILRTLFNIFLHDSKNFINAQRFEYLMPAIVDQLENRLVLEQESLKKILSECIAQLAVDVSNDVLWKQLNYQVLLKTRTSVPEVRIFAFNCCVEIARKLGDDFTTLLPETVPFIAELFEDENPRVEKNTRKSVQELEVILGESLQKYL